MAHHRSRAVLRLRARISLMFCVLVVLSVWGTATLAVRRSTEALLESRFDQLETIQRIKSQQVSAYFAERRSDLEVLAVVLKAFRRNATDSARALHRAQQAAAENSGDLEEQGDWVSADAAGRPVVVVSSTLETADGIVPLRTEHHLIAPERPGLLDRFAQAYGYYDIFLIDPDGLIFYSVRHESDYQTNILTGPYAGSSLGDAVSRALATTDFAFADYRPYAPSAGEPASFIAQPIPAGGTIDFVLAFQMPVDAVNAIMQERTGMGETGESYLVGPDLLMRSDTYLDPEHRSIRASFADPVTGRVETEASRAALDGVHDRRVISDYDGNRVLSAFGPLEIYDTTWALISEIKYREVEAPILQFRRIVYLVSALMLIVAVVGALVFAQSISGPMMILVSAAGELACGRIDLPSVDRGRFAALHHRRDELGSIARACRDVTTYQREKVATAQAIAAGKLDTDVRPASDGDVLSHAMAQMRDARRNYERQLEEQRTEMERLARHLQRAREEQTSFIAQEVHDELGQSLSSMEMHLTVLEDSLSRASDPSLEKTADTLRSILQETTRRSRQLVEELRPTVLDRLGLGEAVRQLVGQFDRGISPSILLTIEPDLRLAAGDLSPERALAVYRVVQEAVTNAVKHSQATVISVDLMRGGGELIVAVRDNGIGFDPAAAVESHGLTGMRERAMSCGGTLRLSSFSGGGTVVRLALAVGGDT